MRELANLAVYLLDPGSAYVNGQTIAIDGGDDGGGGDLGRVAALEAVIDLRALDAGGRRRSGVRPNSRSESVSRSSMSRCAVCSMRAATSGVKEPAAPEGAAPYAGVLDAGTRTLEATDAYLRHEV